MSKPREVSLNHGQIEGLYLEGWTKFIEKSAANKLANALTFALRWSEHHTDCSMSQNIRNDCDCFRLHLRQALKEYQGEE